MKPAGRPLPATKPSVPIAGQGTQPDLLKLPAAPNMREFLRGRLPHNELLNVSDVAVACDVCVSKVYLWIDERMVDAIDIGTSQKPYWKIYRPSVLKLIDKLTADISERTSTK
jgi:hypothetical protein